MREEVSNPADRCRPAGATLKLRLLGTTDVHSHLLAHDYHADRPGAPHGLARLARLIRTSREGAPNCILFDNGDFLQGGPLGDLMTLRDFACGEVHPAISAMNALGYDAAALGNHEFDFGLDWLHRALAAAAFPVTCANLLTLEGGDDATPLFPPFLLLDRVFTDLSGEAHALRIGVIGLAPPQVTTWNRHHLHGRARSVDMLQAIRCYLPRLRAEGTDIVVALAHTGIVPGPERPHMENAALPLGAVDGIDAILAGHTHQVFPSAQFAGIAGICPRQGLLHGTPAVMAGSRGSHLGVLDLDLRQEGGRWRVMAARPEVRRVEKDVPDDPGLSRLLAPAHARTLRRVARPLGHTPHPLHSYLALAAPCGALRLVNEAKIRAVRAMIRGTRDACLPVLAATAPFKTGGRGGPRHYTDVPAGPVHAGHAMDLYSFPNLLCVLRLDGAALRDWLERAAVIYRRILPGSTGQILVDRVMPGHHFDMIEGLSYEIDVTRPARYDAKGVLVRPDSWRIRDLRFDGQPLKDEHIFILATNSYRAHGAGPFEPQPDARFVDPGSRPMREVVADYIARGGTLAPERQGCGWALRRVPQTRVILETGPGLRSYPQDIASLGARDTGDSAEGFLRLDLPLG